MVIFHKSRCYNGGKQHKFESISEEVPVNIQFRTEICYTPKELTKILHAETYLYDICEWCGKIISRQENKK